ncbi:MAG: sulfatase-like hydrolase/transferase [Pyrinomonadaceae bacterium]
MFKDFVTALSLANLCFLRTWQHLLSPAYYYTPSSRVGELVGVVCNVILFTSLFWAGATLARRSHDARLRKVAESAFLLALVLPLNGLRAELPLPRLTLLLGRSGLVLACVAVLLCVAVLVLRRRRGLVRAAVALLLILSPFVLITFAQATWYVLQNRPTAAALNKVPPAPIRSDATTARPRVVWILFDELDYRAAFDARPASLSLPELDRLRAASLFATDAYATTDKTLTAIPSLLGGRLACRAEESRPDELILTFEDGGARADWSTQSNVFTRAREIGVASSLVGWYHPYCRVLRESVDACHSVTMARQTQGVAGKMLRQFNTALSPLNIERFISPRTYDADRREHVNEYLDTLAAARGAATALRYGLVFLHFPVPHPLGIYDRRASVLSADRGLGYFDNVALADKTLGELRRAMEEAGVWDSTTVIVTSDHWWRVGEWESHGALSKEDVELWEKRTDHRVPFILKLAGQKEGATYDAGFNTVLTQDLVLTILGGNVTDAEGARRWLDAHRTFADSPCNK